MLYLFVRNISTDTCVREDVDKLEYAESKLFITHSTAA